MNQLTNNTKQVVIERKSVFSHFEPAILNEIILKSQIKHLDSGQLIIEEDAMIHPEFYILIEGELEAFKQDSRNRHYVLNIIMPGDVFGEGILLGEQQRASSVRAVSASEVLVIPNQAIEQFAPRYPSSVTQFYKALHAQTVYYLKKINEKNTQLIDYQKNLSFFLVNIVVFLSIFSILVSYIHEIIHNIYPVLITTPLVFIGSVLLFARLRSLGLPLSIVGVTTKNLKKSVIEAAWISCFILVSILLLKYCLIHFTDKFSQKHLFYTQFQRYKIEFGINMTGWMFLANQMLYATHAVFQELIARGSIQGMFMQILPKHKGFLAIVLASLVFASAHAYFGIAAVLAVFLPGLLWGWLYARQRNIFGVIVSHLIIGIGFLGFINW